MDGPADEQDIGDEIHGVVTSVRGERQGRLARERVEAQERERTEGEQRRRARRTTTLATATFAGVALLVGGGVGYAVGHGSAPEAPAARTVTAKADESARMRALAADAASRRDWDAAIAFAEQAGGGDAQRYRRNGAQALEAQARTALTDGDAVRAKGLATQARRQYGAGAERAPGLIDRADAALAGTGEAGATTPVAPATGVPTAP